MCFLLSSLNLRYVVVKVHDSWAEFQDYFRQQVLLISDGVFWKPCFLSLIKHITVP